MPTFEGAVEGAGLHVAIVAARWNSFVTEILLEGAVKTLKEKGVAEDAIHTVRVPGAFEIPAAAQWAAVSGKIDAVICLGAVIRGETAHFEYVAGGAQQGILNVTHTTGVPVVFGVLTVDTVEQAMERAGGKHGHKGEESALTAIEMANLRKQLSKGL